MIGSGCVHCGVTGMVMEATPANPIRRKVLNDVGAFIAKGALDRIGAYVGSPSTFDDVCRREGCLPRVHAPFGYLTTAQWVHMSRIRCRTVGRSATIPVFLTRSGVLLKMRICGEIRIPAPPGVAWGSVGFSVAGNCDEDDRARTQREPCGDSRMRPCAGLNSWTFRSQSPGAGLLLSPVEF